jgi:mRNA interferase RelE/StbE
MQFQVTLVPSADKDLDFYGTHDQRLILDAMEEFLEIDADLESKRRRPLRPNPLAPWELRLGDYRVFYEITVDRSVRVLAIGHKVHNELFIRGEKVEI